MEDIPMVNRFQKSFSFHPSQCLWGLCIALLISFVGRTPITPHQRPPESALVCTSHGDSQELRSSWDLFQPAWKAEPLPHYHLKDLMSDPQNRIEPVMKIPKAILIMRILSLFHNSPFVLHKTMNLTKNCTFFWKESANPGCCPVRI